MGDDVLFRTAVEFTDHKRFILSSKTFDRQFSNIYVARLSTLRHELAQKAKAKWANHEVTRLTNLANANQDTLYIVVGILYKHQKLKPSILRELSDELQLPTQSFTFGYASSTDSVYLEDEALRVKLIGHVIDVREIVTGLICAVLGRPLEDGSFWVEDLCFPGYYPKLSTSVITINKNAKILLISGLDFVNNADSVGLNLLSEWITGMVGHTQAQREEASIVRVIIAGNSVRGSVETYNHKGYLGSKLHDQTAAKESALSTHRFDNFLSTIVQCCCVTLMPGEFDPVCHTLPQQPFHPCILPESAKFKSFHGATNPWIGSIGSRIVAGSNGQPIADIMKVANLANLSPLEWLERTLTWQHYAPTAPDTLPVYPYFDTDPFIMRECPDIYFVGNMDSYDTKITKGDEGQIVRLICVPKFSETQTAVLVDLQDLKTSPISFGVS